MTDRMTLFQQAIAAAGITRSVFLATSFRSGSTFLGRSLFEGSGVPLHLERFNQVPTWFKLPQREVENLIRAALATEAHGVFGTKIMWPHRNNLAGFVGVEAQSADLFRAFPNPAFILLSRADKAAQAVSFHVARSLDIWSAAPPEDVAAHNVDYSFQTIHRYYTTFLSHDHLWRSYLARHGFVPEIVDYDSLAADPASCLATLRRALSWPGETQPVNVARRPDPLCDLKAGLLARFREDLHRYSPPELLPTRLTGPMSFPG